MKKTLFCVLSSSMFISCNSSKNEEAADTPAASTVAEPAAKQEMPTELADEKYTETGKKQLANLSSGNVTAGWTVLQTMQFIFGTTVTALPGKQLYQLLDKRRGEDIDSLTFIQPVYLPIKVNVPQQPAVAAGTWLLTWYMVETKYKKSGKKMRQWIHTDLHFDSNDKVDRLIQYIDRSLVTAAEKK